MSLLERNTPPPLIKGIFYDFEKNVIPPPWLSENFSFVNRFTLFRLQNLWWNVPKFSGGLRPQTPSPPYFKIYFFRPKYEYITQVAKRGGSLCLHGFRTFFLKNRFLSDYVVPACPKYISGKLRSFSKNFSFFFFIPHFLKIFYRLGTPQNRPWPKK